MLMSPVTARAAGSNRFADAFGELFRRHHRYLRGVARRALPNGNDVEDVVQTACLMRSGRRGGSSTGRRCGRGCTASPSTPPSMRGAAR